MVLLIRQIVRYNAIIRTNMNERKRTMIQEKLAILQQPNENGKRWTLTALAEALGLKLNTLEKWKAGQREPANEKAVLAMLEQLEKRKRIPKQRRYTKGSR